MRFQHFFLILISILSYLFAPFVSAQKVKNSRVDGSGALAKELSQGPTRSLSLAEVVTLALEHSPDLESAAAKARGANARYSQSKAERYPSLLLTGDLNGYNEPLLLDDQVIRDAVTVTTSATLAVPLTSQYVLNKKVKAGSYGVEATEIAREVQKREVIWQAERAYTELLKAHALKNAAQASVELAQAQVKRVKRYISAGSLAKNDLLKAELNLSEFEQTLIRADMGVLLAEGVLAVIVGLPPETHIKPSQSYSRNLSKVSISLSEATSTALERRPELDQAQANFKMSEALRDSSRGANLPSLNAVLVGRFSEGSVFQNGPEAFAGLTFSWNAFNWGATRNQVATADAVVDQSRSHKTKIKDLVVLDVRQRYLNLLGTKASLQVARKAIESAEENLSITQTRFEKSSATTTDLLDAQVLLTRAQVLEITARYDFYIAFAGLYKAMGEPVSDNYMVSTTR